MTGTALTEADEFREIYGLGVVEIPTNRPVARKDEHDAVYRTAREKYEAIVKAIQRGARARASRSWSAPPPSRSPRCCRTSSRRRASRTTC